MGSYETVHGRMEKIAEDGRKERKNHMRLIDLVCCPSLMGPRMARRGALFSGTRPGQKRGPGKFAGSMTRLRDQERNQGPKLEK